MTHPVLKCCNNLINISSQTLSAVPIICFQINLQTRLSYISFITDYHARASGSNKYNKSADCISLLLLCVCYNLKHTWFISCWPYSQPYNQCNNLRAKGQVTLVSGTAKFIHVFTKCLVVEAGRCKDVYIFNNTSELLSVFFVLSCYLHDQLLSHNCL